MFKRILLTVWLALALAVPALATSVIPLNLEQLVDGSAIAFQGVCVDNRTGRDPQTGLIVTMTTFRVDDVLKGSVPANYTIKQVGGEDSQANIKFKVSGVPTFKAGQGYVVFLAGVSSAGFSSPVGLSQGSFDVVEGAGGPEVGNGRDFGDLTANTTLQLPAQAKAKAQVSRSVDRIKLEDFKQMVREHVGKQ
jgi:hypothetical protein